MMTDLVVVVITAPEEAAEGLARSLVERRLAACVQVVPHVRSTYRWKGEVETSKEARLEIKTSGDRVLELVAAVKELHSYDVPEVVVLPILGGNPDYLAWVKAETTAS